MNIRMNPPPTTGMGGQIFGQQDGSFKGRSRSPARRRGAAAGMAHSSLGSVAHMADRVEDRPIRGPGLVYRYAGGVRALAAVAAAVGAAFLFLVAPGAMREPLQLVRRRCS